MNIHNDDTYVCIDNTYGSRKNSAKSVVSDQEIQKQTGDSNSRITGLSRLEAESTVDKDKNLLILQLLDITVTVIAGRKSFQVHRLQAMAWEPQKLLFKFQVTNYLSKTHHEI